MAKFETVRQGFIREVSKILVARYGIMSEQTYRQNAWGIIMNDIMIGNSKYRAYYHKTTPLAKTRLYNEIARAAYQLTQSSIPPVMRGLKPYSICEGDVTRYR